MSVAELADELFKTASNLQPDEIISKLVEIFNVGNIAISKSDIEHLMNDPDWDDAAQTFHELILQDMKPTFDFQVCFKIDRALSYINPKVQPGTFWWRAYGYPAAKNLKVGHGLFTFDNQFLELPN
jgi:hypothetical protein